MTKNDSRTSFEIHATDFAHDPKGSIVGLHSLA